MLDTIPHGDVGDDLTVDKVWPREITSGLVIIGPTTRADGRPDETILNERIAVWIGHLREDHIEETLAKLQAGNPQPLAVYVRAKATWVDVLQLSQALDPYRTIGSWFSVWPPLLNVIKALRGEVD